MGNGHLDIGIGYGGADVYNNQPALQNFSNLIAQQNAKRQREMDALAAEFAKSSPVGIREPDRQGYMDKYAQLQELGRQKINERDQWKKAQLQAQIDKGFQDLGGYVSDSKANKANEEDFGKRLLDHNFRDQFEDNAIDQYMGSRKLPSTDPKYIKDYNTLARQVNAQAVLDRLDKHDKAIYDATKYNTDLNGKPINPLSQRVTVGNRSGTIFTNQKIVDPRTQALGYGMEYDSNPQFRQFMRQRYPEIYANSQSPEEAKSQAIQTLVKERAITNREKPGDIKFDEKVPQLTPYQQWEINWKKAHDDNASGTANPQPALGIPYKSGTANFAGKNYVGVSLPNKNFAGAPAIDLDMGKHVKALAPSDDYSIVGAADIPIITKGNLKGNPAQPNFEKQHPDFVDHQRMLQVQQKTADGSIKHFLIPYDRLPANIAAQKDVKHALSKFNQTPVYGSQTHGKEVPMTKISALAGTKGYEGYTPAELADYYKSLGYVIK